MPSPTLLAFLISRDIQTNAIAHIIKNIKKITEANIVDDYGFARVQSLYRHTFLDEPIFDGATAESYVASSVHYGFSWKMEHNDVFFYDYCQWHGDKIHSSCYLSEMPITNDYLLRHANNVAMTINENHQPVFYLVCGYYMCTLNKLPYVQELCIPIETMQDHPYKSSRYSQRVIISSVNPSDSTNGGLFPCIVSTSTYSFWITVMRLSVSPCLNSSVQCQLICRNLGSSFLINSGHLGCSRSPRRMLTRWRTSE